MSSYAATYKVARNLSWVGIQTKGSFPLFSPQSLQKLKLANDERSMLQGANQLVAEQNDLENSVRKTAITIALVIDAVVGIIVAWLATGHRDNQFIYIIEVLVGIQLVLALGSYYFVKWQLGMLLNADEIPYFLREELAEMLAEFRSLLWKAFPVRILEFFVFTCLFLLFGSFSVQDVSQLGSVEQGMHHLLDVVSTFFYGPHRAPQTQFVAGAFGTIATLLTGAFLQRMLPSKVPPRPAATR